MRVPDRTISASEAEKLRDRMHADEDKSTENLSTISRSLAIGLALFTYTFFMDDKINGFLTNNFLGLLAASVLGVLALTADTLHYLFAMLQVRLLRRRIKRQIEETTSMTFANLDRFERNAFYWLRWVMFWSKLIFVGCGVSIVVVIILRSAATLVQSSTL
jgi:hypothetical protein